MTKIHVHEISANMGFLDDWGQFIRGLEPGPLFEPDNLKLAVTLYLVHSNLDPNDYDITISVGSYGYGTCPTDFLLSVTPKPIKPSFTARIPYASRKPRLPDGHLDYR